MEPRYSILLCNQSYEKYQEKIKYWLSMGIKVIWFSQNAEEIAALKGRYPAFTKIFLLMAYKLDVSYANIIIDGQDKERFVERVLEKECPEFNSAQYLVEHCNAKDHIIVQASAGTGKTSVMIDRIMFLMHTQENLHLSEMYMITFTNDATNQMNKRLQEALMKRYLLTGQRKYLTWVEEQSQMNISTIHSFALNMLKQFGIGEGFTKGLSIRSFQYERNELIMDTIDSDVDENRTITSQFGVPFYKAKNLIGDFWSAFSRKGISHSDIAKMDWGKPVDGQSASFHKLLSGIIEGLDEDYFEIKRQEEGISVDDIMRDLQAVLLGDPLPHTDISMKYLFIDEFQDSDLAQIYVACQLVKLLGASLFVVGDVKQSIYRFRGANEQSFTVLRNTMAYNRLGMPREFTLVNNYRTAAGVLERMDDYFKAWGDRGLLQYDKPVIPFNKNEGYMRMLIGQKKEELDEQIGRIAEVQLKQLINKIEKEGIKPSDKTRVVFLTRSNAQLGQLAKIFRKRKLPAVVRRDGSFYASEAVRDFYIMVSSFMFCDEPKHVFNYLLTPYAGEIDPMNMHDMESLHGDYDLLVEYLDHFLDQTTWKQYHKELRLRPVMAVFKDMLDSISVVDNFIANSRARKKAEGWEEDRYNAATATEARQYQANLEKLMEILQRNLGGDKVSLYDVYNFLRLNIATNRKEGEPDITASDDYRSILCMTVHKSKGLEFDTVVIPYTTQNFGLRTNTEILIDPVSKKVGWNYNGSGGKRKQKAYPEMSNSHYEQLKEEDAINTSMEEARILYVAMTRAIDTLICIVPDTKNKNTWANMIEEVGVDYE